MKRIITIVLVGVFVFSFSGCLSDRGWKNVNNHMERQWQKDAAEHEYYQRQYRKNYPSYTPSRRSGTYDSAICGQPYYGPRSSRGEGACQK